jgi:hypothetical protein
VSNDATRQTVQAAAKKPSNTVQNPREIHRANEAALFVRNAVSRAALRLDPRKGHPPTWTVIISRMASVLVRPDPLKCREV